MALRIFMVLVAAAAIGFGVSRLRETDRCDQAKKAIDVAIYQRTFTKHGPGERALRAPQARLVASCRDRTELARYAALEGTVGLTGLAASLAREVTRLEPRNRFGWLALALVLDRVDPAGAAAARRRGHALDPRGIALPSASG